MYACAMSEVGAEGFNGVVVEVYAGENFPRIVLVWRVVKPAVKPAVNPPQPANRSMTVSGFSFILLLVQCFVIVNRGAIALSPLHALP